MDDLLWYQYVLIALIFIWSGFVRSSLGFGGSVLSLPFLLLVENIPLVYLPLIAVHLLFFSSITVFQSHRQSTAADSTVDWVYLRYALLIIIIPKLVGVFGLITLPATVMSGIIFSIVAVYALSYIFNRPFQSNNKALDVGFLMLGGYASGTSLVGAPLIVSVFASHVAKNKLRNTLFILWFILVSIKMGAFIWAGIDLQLIHHLWLLPCVGLGHYAGLRFHSYMLNVESYKFFRGLGWVLLLISCMGLFRAFT